jgi:hypothetical protein
MDNGKGYGGELQNVLAMLNLTCTIGAFIEIDQAFVCFCFMNSFVPNKK